MTPTPRSAHRRTVAQDGDDRRAAVNRLLRELSSLADDDPRRPALREELVTSHVGLVEHLARRFKDRGEPLDDLVQVGMIGLLKSLDRFDVERGVEFVTYAAPTILGEIKRHFRDRGWAIRVPRHLQEIRLALAAATQDLTHELQRSPTTKELAERLGTSEEEVLEGLEASYAYSTYVLDPAADPESDAPALVDVLGEEDTGLVGVENRESLRPLLAELPARERRILTLRFYGGMTQSQIAAELGISQMHVSRLLAKTLAQLRNQLLQEDPG
jgi:RNA polymerase sigma-B factor